MSADLKRLARQWEAESKALYKKANAGFEHAGHSNGEHATGDEGWRPTIEQFAEASTLEHCANQLRESLKKT